MVSFHDARASIAGCRQWTMRPAVGSIYVGNGTVRAVLRGGGMVVTKRHAWTATMTLLLSALLAAHALAADPAKVLRVAFDTAETGFDPVKVTDNYSSQVLRCVFDRLLSYDYLARPVKLIPMAAEALPEVTDGGKTYT